MRAIKTSQAPKESTSGNPPATPTRRELFTVAAAPLLLSATCIVSSRSNTTKAVPSAGGWTFSLSLAQWSLHRAFHGGTIDPADFPAVATREYGIDAVEYVNQFYMDKAGNGDYFRDLRKRCDDLAVRSVLIMCDVKEKLGDPDPAARRVAIDAHRPWLDAAQILGCHCVRVNLEGAGTPEEHQKQAADALRRLVEIASPMGLGVIVENHGGNSSNGQWMTGVMQLVDHPDCGTLPDFGNFYEYDRYQGVADMLPFAKGVSAKSWDFDPATGEETKMNYWRFLKLVRAAGYEGRVGIEYEGERMSEPDGIRATKALLEEIRESLAKR